MSMNHYLVEPIHVGMESGNGTNLEEEQVGLPPADAAELARAVHGIAVRVRIADKASARSKLLVPGDNAPWRCVPFNRFRSNAAFTLNNWDGKSGTLVLGDYDTLSSLVNTPTAVPYVQGLGGPMVGITIGTTNHVPYVYTGANSLCARYFGPVTARLWLSVMDYTFMSGTPT